MFESRDAHAESERADRENSGSSNSPEVEALVEDLRDRSPAVRRNARLALLSIGRLAVPALADALNEPGHATRWEAVKTLVDIGDPSAAGALVWALEDSNDVVRWTAARGLISLRKEGLPALLKALMDRPESPWLRFGARHVLHELAKRDIKQEVMPVLRALDGIEPVLQVPLAAFQALDSMERAA